MANSLDFQWKVWILFKFGFLIKSQIWDLFRHTFATRCYEKGVREKVVQKILGHSKLDMTLNVYTHTTDEMIAEDIRKLEG